jgi:hypothetical protein
LRPGAAGGRAEDRRGGCGRPPAGRATTSQRDVVRLSQGKVPGVLAVGGARAGRGGAGVVSNCRWVPVSSNQFQFEKIMRRRNQNAACLTGWAVSVGSERWLAGAARAERRALPTQVPSHSQLRLLPLILMNCGSFQSIPNTFQEIMWRRNQNAARLAGWAVSVGCERWLAGESGVVAPALPPQSKTRGLQAVLPWAEDTMCRGLATANSMGLMNCGSFQ